MIAPAPRVPLVEKLEAVLVQSICSFEIKSENWSCPEPPPNIAPVVVKFPDLKSKFLLESITKASSPKAIVRSLSAAFACIDQLEPSASESNRKKGLVDLTVILAAVTFPVVTILSVALVQSICALTKPL